MLPYFIPYLIPINYFVELIVIFLSCGNNPSLSGSHILGIPLITKFVSGFTLTSLTMLMSGGAFLFTFYPNVPFIPETLLTLSFLPYHALFLLMLLIEFGMHFLLLRNYIKLKKIIFISLTEWTFCISYFYLYWIIQFY